MTSHSILLVEDDPSTLTMTEDILRECGHEVVTASDGEEALRAVRRKMPDLVVTDIMMPNMDGWSLVRQLRSEPGSAFVPVVFLTALGSPEHRKYGYHLGADDYMSKPFSFRDLQNRVEEILRQRSELKQKWSGRIPEGEGGPAFKGRLNQIGVAPLVTLLDMERKTGELVLGPEAPGEPARVLLRNGRIVRISVPGIDPADGMDGFAALVQWQEGSFAFYPREIIEVDIVNTSTPALLMEAARRLDEE